MIRFAVVACLILFATALPMVGAASQGRDKVLERGYDDQGRLVFERGVRSDNDAIAFERFYHQADSKARPSGGGGSGGGGSADPGTDCEPDAFRKASWKWAAPYSAQASAYPDVFDAAGRTWDDQTAASLFAGITAGSSGTAGTKDGINQIDFVSLSSSSTIAVTTTWYNRFTGQAVESDGQYNTYYAWATDGSPAAMDVLDIATHEIGHTFGLDHPKGGGIGCLTMYAYADYGELAKRTLGDGDILGIKAIYGA